MAKKTKNQLQPTTTCQSPRFQHGWCTETSRTLLPPLPSEEGDSGSFCCCFFFVAVRAGGDLERHRAAAAPDAFFAVPPFPAAPVEELFSLDNITEDDGAGGSAVVFAVSDVLAVFVDSPGIMRPQEL